MSKSVLITGYLLARVEIVEIIVSEGGTSHHEHFLLLQQCFLNSFSAKGNIALFANNAYSGESTRNELSHLKSALFSCKLKNIPKILKHENKVVRVLNMGESTLNNSALKGLSSMMQMCQNTSALKKGPMFGIEERADIC